MAKATRRLVPPTTEIRTVPLRRPNAELRTREYLTEAEVDRLMSAAKGNRYGHRDATMALVAYRHGLRASELVDLRWGAGGLQNGLPARQASQARQP
jgi:integrase